jgi:hypothetical protein
MFLFAGYMMAAIMVLSLFFLADWSARNNLPPTLRDALEKVIAGYGNAGNRPVLTRRDRDTHAVYPRRPERVAKSL